MSDLSKITIDEKIAVLKARLEKMEKALGNSRYFVDIEFHVYQFDDIWDSLKNQICEEYD